MTTNLRLTRPNARPEVTKTQTTGRWALSVPTSKEVSYVSVQTEGRTRTRFGVRPEVSTYLSDELTIPTRPGQLTQDVYTFLRQNGGPESFDIHVDTSIHPCDFRPSRSTAGGV